MTDKVAGPDGSEFSEGLGLGPTRAMVERLRFLASGQDDPKSVALAEAAAEIESLANLVEGLNKWHDEGLKLLDGDGPGAMFSIGRWWGERPWFKR